MINGWWCPGARKSNRTTGIALATCSRFQLFIQLWAHDLRTVEKHPAYTPHGTLYLQSFTLLANNHSLPTCTTHCHTTDCTWRADRSKCIGVSAMVQKIQYNDIIYNNNTCMVSRRAESEKGDGETGRQWNNESRDYCYLWVSAMPAIGIVGAFPFSASHPTSHWCNYQRSSSSPIAIPVFPLHSLPRFPFSIPPFLSPFNYPFSSLPSLLFPLWFGLSRV